MEELLDPRQTAVIVIDVENGFASDESTLARAGLDVSQGRAAIPRMNELLRAARASGVHIVYMQSVYSQEMNLPNNYAFSDTPLNLHLRARGIKTLAFIGIETCTCVETSARHAFILGYNVVIVSDCCASCGATVQESRELHDAALRILGARFGKILTSSEVARAWSGALATAAP
jgi:ureidoacrylate peracid hydrolase